MPFINYYPALDILVRTNVSCLMYVGTTGEGWFFFIRKQAQEHSGSSDSDSDNSQYDDDVDYEEFAVAIPKFTLTIPEFIH